MCILQSKSHEQFTLLDPKKLLVLVPSSISSKLHSNTIWEKILMIIHGVIKMCLVQSPQFDLNSTRDNSK